MIDLVSLLFIAMISIDFKVTNFPNTCKLHSCFPLSSILNAEILAFAIVYGFC